MIITHKLEKEIEQVIGAMRVTQSESAEYTAMVANLDSLSKTLKTLKEIEALEEAN